MENTIQFQNPIEKPYREAKSIPQTTIYMTAQSNINVHHISSNEKNTVKSLRIKI